MPVAQLTLELRIEHAQSLKDRRQVVRSMKDQLRQGFNISVAEMDEAVTWQSATLGVVAISGSRSYLHQLLRSPPHVQGRANSHAGLVQHLKAPVSRHCSHPLELAAGG